MFAGVTTRSTFTELITLDGRSYGCPGPTNANRERGQRLYIDRIKRAPVGQRVQSPADDGNEKRGGLFVRGFRGAFSCRPPSVDGLAGAVNVGSFIIQPNYMDSESIRRRRRRRQNRFSVLYFSMRLYRYGGARWRIHK